MKAIETRYLGATIMRSSRIVATTEGGNRLTIAYDSEREPDVNHAVAAQALMDKLEWGGTMTGGHTARGMVWVFTGGRQIHGRTR